MAEPTITSAPKKILILGGSYGGISTAHYLLKHAIPSLPQGTHQIILISPSTQAMCRPACPRALISDSMFVQEKLFVDIPALFQSYPEGSFEFRQGTATETDFANRTVTVTPFGSEAEYKLDFHALVIATGASSTSPLLGFTRDATFLREKWAEFRKSLPDAKSILIAGGGPSGIETAGELGEYLNGRGVSRSGKQPKVSITVVTAGSKILPLLRPAIANKAETFLADLGVTVIKNAKVTALLPEGVGSKDVGTAATVTLDDGTKIEADLFIPATGMKYNTGFIDKSLLTADGRVDTNSSTLRVDKAGPRIYAIGDASSAARPAVHNILGEIPVVCANIKLDLLGEEGGKDRTFTEDKREMQLVPIGKSKGVGAAMGWSLPSIMVWGIKGRDYWLWTMGGLWNGNQWAKES